METIILMQGTTKDLEFAVWLSAGPNSLRPLVLMLQPRELTCGAVRTKGSQADELLLLRLAGGLLELLQQEAGGGHLLEVDPAGRKEYAE